MYKLLLLFLVITSNCCLAQRMLSVEEQKEDFSQFRERIIKGMGIFDAISEKNLKKHLDSIENTITDSAKLITFLGKIRSAIKPISESHYLSAISTSDENEIYEPNIFPIVVWFKNDSTLTVLQNYSGALIAPKDIITKINGISISQLRSELNRFVIVDNQKIHNQVLNWKLSKRFPEYLMFLFENSNEYEIEWLDADHAMQAKKSKVETLHHSFSYQNHLEKLYPRDVTYEYLDSINTAFLRISHFGFLRQGFVMVDGEPEKVNTPKDLKNFFRKIKRKNYDNLIIDIRDNYGGDLSNVFLLPKYLTQNRKSVCLHSQFDLNYDGLPDVNTAHYVRNNRFAFDGTIYIFCNTSNYSAAVFLTHFLKSFSDAKIVGEIPGGLPYKTLGVINHYNFENLTNAYEYLDNSGIVLLVPNLRLTFVADERPKDFTPDIPIETKIEDLLNYEEDSQLMRFLQILQKGNE